MIPINERGVQLALWRDLCSNVALAVPNFTPLNWWECDMWSLSKSGYWSEYEIKLTVADFNKDREKREQPLGRWDRHTKSYSKVPERVKHDLLASGSVDGPSRFWYLLPESVLSKVTVPPWAGVREIVHWKGRTGLRIRQMAPQLHRQKCSEQIIATVKTAFFYRFWTHAETAYLLQSRRRVQAKAETDSF